MEHRDRYLDVVAEGNKENYKPIVEFMAEVYLQQHSRIQDQIYDKVMGGEITAFPEYERLVRQFLRL